MRIAIATDDWKSISSHFYKSKGFAIFEINGKIIKSQEYHSNSYENFEGKGDSKNQSSNKQIKTLNILKSCNIVIFKNIEKRIYDELRKKGINIIDTDKSNVKDILDFFMLQNNLYNSELII